MGLFDKARRYLRSNPDKVQRGIDKAASTLDERTKGKYSRKINKAADRAQRYTRGQGRGN